MKKLRFLTLCFAMSSLSASGNKRTLGGAGRDSVARCVRNSSKLQCGSLVVCERHNLHAGSRELTVFDGIQS